MIILIPGMEKLLSYRCVKNDDQSKEFRKPIRVLEILKYEK